LISNLLIGLKKNFKDIENRNMHISHSQNIINERTLRIVYLIPKLIDGDLNI